MHRASQQLRRLKAKYLYRLIGEAVPFGTAWMLAAFEQFHFVLKHGINRL
jgi:hypothetical protein